MRMSPPAMFAYLPAQVREMDRTAIQDLGIPGYTLMCRAGEASFRLARSRFPNARHWLILCGAGNNAGDGYVIARLARAAGFDVSVAALHDPQQLAGDAATAWRTFRDGGASVVQLSQELLQRADLVVDAMLGTGLDRPLEGQYRHAVEAVNESGRAVLAVDIPTGLHGATGEVLGCAVQARLTATFVGLKQGFFLGEGPDHTGEILLDDLGIPAAALGHVGPTLRVFGSAELGRLLPARRPTSHKGRFGHVLVVGGNHGMGGAARMAGEAALRAGAGLVSVATRPGNVAAITGNRPELMCHGIEDARGLAALLGRASVLALGPGLGQDDWARQLWSRCLDAGLPTVIDADGLNLLAEGPQRAGNWILTPHPGEAARLLGMATSAVQRDRLGAVTALSSRYGGVAVLKGRCTLIARSGDLPYVIAAGNPAMATAGMGDVLTGLIAGLLAQAASGDALRSAAAGAYVHAMAGDAAAAGATRGLVATDLFAHLRPWLNPAS